MRDIEELRELREYDAGAPPLDDATRRRVRLRLSTAMTAEAGPAPAPAVRRRPALRAALTGVVAAAVVGGVVVAGQGGGGQTGGPPGPAADVDRFPGPAERQRTDRAQWCGHLRPEARAGGQPEG
jgi:hypothetical protein